MRLAELEPEWWSDFPGRLGQGLAFRCPHCDERLAIAFSNPVDGSSMSVNAKVVYKRRGTTFHQLTVEPRIFVPGHVRIRIANGGVVWEA